MILAVQDDDVDVGIPQRLRCVEATKTTTNDDNPRTRHRRHMTRLAPMPSTMKVSALTIHASRQTMIARNVSS